MDRYWEDHWWLIIILAVFAVPIVQALLAPWRHYLSYREHRDAIEALKVYATQGKEPPTEVLDALNGRRWRRRWRAAARSSAESVVNGPAAEQWWTARADRWRAREPLRRWNWAIFAGAIAIGFGYASQHVHANTDTYLVVAIIAGALTVAGAVSALIATFWRID